MRKQANTTKQQNTAADPFVTFTVCGPMKNFGTAKFMKIWDALNELDFEIVSTKSSKTREQRKSAANVTYSSTQVVALPFNDGVTRDVEIDGTVNPKIFKGLVFQYYEDNNSFGNIMIYSKNGKTTDVGCKSFPVLVYGDDYWKRRRCAAICDNDAFYYGSDAYEKAAA